MVLANKSDCDPNEIEVTDAEIKKFEEERKIKVIKASAKTGQNVDESFLDMTKKLIVKKNNSSNDDKKKSLGLKILREQSDANGTPSANTCC